MEQTITTLRLAQLPADDRSEIDRWDEAFGQITGGVTEAFGELGKRFGTSMQTARRKYYLWRKHGKAGLVDGSKHPSLALTSAAALLSTETIDYYKRLCMENGRKCLPAYRRMVREFFGGDDIPGLPPGAPRLRLPPGWSNGNFARHAPAKFELRAARQGLRAAAEFRPLVYTTRKEMHFFEELQFDDVWHDIETLLIGRAQRVRPQQLGGMEVLSACLFEWCMKPRIRREDGSRVNLGQWDTLFLVAAILGKYGHHPRGTRLNLEAGTATLPSDSIDLVHKLSGGAVTCRVGETSNEPAFLGQYPGASKGNFRTRALVESFWNLTHNETADRRLFPGQTGAVARVDAPEDLHGRAREQDIILRAMPALPAHVIETLRQPLPEYHQAVRAIDEINERMNQRGIMPGTKHAIEGFTEAGLVTTDFDLPGIGLVSRREFESRLQGRSEAEKNAILALCIGRARTLSPREVFDAGLRGALPPTISHATDTLVKWRREALALLLYPARRSEAETVDEDHLVTFEDKDISPEPLRYLAHHFTPGDTFEVVCNPMVPDLLWIYDARPSHKGAWLGVLTAWGRASKSDAEAVGQRIGQAEKIKRELLAPVVQQGMGLTRKRLEDLEHNNEVLTASQRAEASAEAAQSDAIDEALAKSMDVSTG